jgi:hypothetical protein
MAVKAKADTGDFIEEYEAVRIYAHAGIGGGAGDAKVALTVYLSPDEADHLADELRLAAAEARERLVKAAERRDALRAEMLRKAEVDRG